MGSFELVGLLCGLVLVGYEIFAAVRADRRPRLETSVVLLVSALGVCAGVKVFMICLTADALEPFADADRLYIALGGFVMVWVSASTILEKVITK
jgi:hypothetical protein